MPFLANLLRLRFIINFLKLFDSFVLFARLGLLFIVKYRMSCFIAKIFYFVELYFIRKCRHFSRVDE